MPLLVLLTFVVLAFLTGGSARGDVLSLVALRPLAVIAVAYGLALYGHSMWRDHRATALFCLACIALVVVQLVPLPPAIWPHLPGREVVQSIDRTMGFGAAWRPLTLAPARTWNSLFALAVPLATLILTLAVGSRYRWILLYALLIAGIASSLVGLSQAIGAGIYLYRVSTIGEAAGLFANRNHQATFLACMFPLLAVMAGGRGIHEREDRLLRIGAAALALFFVPLLLVTGSRAGLIVGVVGLAAVPLIFSPRPIQTAVRRHRQDRRRFRLTPRQSVALAMAGVALLTGVTIAASRAESVKRLVQGDAFQSRRASVIAPVVRLTGQQALAGAGFGTFADVYRIDEPDAVLAPTYLNQAHDDWLQVVLEGGLPGLALLVWTVLAWGRLTWASLRRPLAASSRIAFARAGAAMMLILGIASVFDYPLRTPALAAMVTMAFVFMLPDRSSEAEGADGDEATNRRNRAGNVSGRVA